MTQSFDFSKVNLYLGYLPSDRLLAEQVRTIFEREGFTVLDTEHSALTMSEYQDKVKNLGQCDIALMILSPEATNAAHLWREVMTCKTQKIPYIPIQVEDMEGHVQLNNIFDARSKNFDELRGRLLWGVCKAVVRNWSALNGYDSLNEREERETQILRSMRNQLMQQAQIRTRQVRQVRKTQATKLLREAQRKRDQERKLRTQELRRATDNSGPLSGLLQRFTS